jgi:hypothetical protein
MEKQIGLEEIIEMKLYLSEPDKSTDELLSVINKLIKEVDNMKLEDIKVRLSSI